MFRSILVTIFNFVKGCDVGKVDCVFVLDVSVSIENDANFGLIRDFVTQAASFMSIGVNETLFSVLLFARHAWINFTIPSYTNRADLINAVDDISYFDVSELNRTGTNIPDALKLLKDGAQDGRIGLRADTNFRYAIFITDGRANTRDLTETQLGRRLNSTERQQLRHKDEEDTLLAAMRLHKSKLYDDVFAIGIGGSRNNKFDELKHIASRPGLDLIIDDFTVTAFQTALQKLIGGICKREQNV